MKMEERWFTGRSGPNKEALVWVTGLPEELMISEFLKDKTGKSVSN